MRATYARISEEIHELSRYALATIAGTTGAWTPVTTDDAVWCQAGE